MRDGTMIGVALLVALVANTAFCDLSVVEKGTIVMISNDYYKLTFDKVRGGTIVALGEHQVTQRDNADGYSLARDEAAEIAIRQISPAQVQISVQARYIEDGKVAESRIEAQYQYLFHADSPLVRCRADIHQNPIAIQAGLPGYLRWQRVTVLDFGDQVGKVTGFSGESTSGSSSNWSVCARLGANNCWRKISSINRAGTIFGGTGQQRVVGSLNTPQRGK